MEKLEKINIYVPQNIGVLLENDVVQFEILKKDGYTVNKNKFLTMLIQGYYETYMQEAQNKYKSICGILADKGLTKETQSEIANEILTKMILPEVPTRKGKNPIRLSLKPTKETTPLIKHILEDLGAEDYISQFFCRMLMSYSENPFWIREHILFKENYEFLAKACEEECPVRFTTIWNVVDMHEVIPYKIVVGQEEMHNYLLCGEKNKITGKWEAKSYRLNRINNLRFGNNRIPLSRDVKLNLDKMIYYAPQHAINQQREICIKLSEKGVRLMNRIYRGRPKVERKVTDGNKYYYYFMCSEEQVFWYFSRFAGKDAEIIYPDDCRNRMIEFHKKTTDVYERIGNNENN